VRAVSATALAGVLMALAVGCGSSGPKGPSFRVPSPAMEPTLHVGEHVVVLVDRNYAPQVGDIIVFRPPRGADSPTPACGNSGQGAGNSAACSEPTSQESSSLFIKRIVALPGDRISIVNGHVIRNGVQEQDASSTRPCSAGDPTCTFRAAIAIPRGDYFVLGDNRGESDDSRFWGPVPRAWIIGKVAIPNR
jgi:signal peptidase I